MLYGVDGCRDGWVVAQAEDDLGSLSFSFAALVGPLIGRAARRREFLAIDIPIGLPQEGSRGCDIQARRVLASRHKSSVFPAPPRIAFTAPADHRSASAFLRKRTGKGISRQAHALLDKIREVDLALTPARQHWIFEAHPELTFAGVMGRPLRHSKKTKAGERERLRILRRHKIHVDIDSAREQVGLTRATRDDIVDAAACLLTAWRVRHGRASGARDAKGLAMTITW